MQGAIRRSLKISTLTLLLMITACSQASFGLPVKASSTPRSSEQPASPSPDERPTNAASTPHPTAPSTPVPSPSAPEEGLQYPVGPFVYPAQVNPLTGLPVADANLLERRPLLIKVSNFPVSARPHAGLSYADLVFEYYIGVGATRFTALFYGEDSPRVGPIRSGRLIDAQLTRMYGGILGMKGAAKYVLANYQRELVNRYISGDRDTCPGICIEDYRSVNGVYADSGAFSSLISDWGLSNDRPNLSGMAFFPEAAPGGEPGNRIHLIYNAINQVRWTYDEARGLYLREQDRADRVLRPITDRLTGEQIAFENVIILITRHDFSTDTNIDINLWGARDAAALAFRDGQVYRLRFSAASTNAHDSPLWFRDAQGAPYYFKPGSTWFEIFTLTSILEGPQNGELVVKFRLPEDYE